MFGLILRILRKTGAAPEMSETERAALAAGDVWIDADFFSGRPDFRKLLNQPYRALSDAEQAFLDGPVEEVCRLLDPVELARTLELAPEVWACLRRHRFFGLGFPKRYGGHEFSALAQSTIFGKLATRSMALSSYVLIPNSVGPGELLLEVGTEAQREYYLPRLARGDEIPCFALTEPEAGSDAAALTSRGEVFRAADGSLALRLDWDKRYITLAPIATLLGLAFRLFDPQNLLGQGTDLGITCALVPTNLPGVEIGRRHDPLGVPFPNGPTRGRDVVVSIDAIIGGRDFAGKGWAMLMEALSGGRAVSLPAQATAGVKMATRIASAYAFVRRQFNVPIARFEGIEEKLAQLGGTSYLLEAARVFTCSALAAGHRPSVVSALMKYNTTELGRRAAVDAMDILGGAAISRGPRNLIAEGYQAAPIGITVEGANILTRTLIVFGQGALRCHPHALALVEALRSGETRAFRRALLGQGLHVTRNLIRWIFLELSRGRLARAPGRGPIRRAYGKLAWASTRFALLTDLAMFGLGAKLKFRGKLTGRLADLLSWQYLAFAALRRFDAEGRRPDDLPFVLWAVEDALGRLQGAFEAFLANFDPPGFGWLFRGPVRWWTRLNSLGSGPTDRLGHALAEALIKPGITRERLCSFNHCPPGGALDRLERAFELSWQSEEVMAKIRHAVKKRRLAKAPFETLIEQAREHGIISAGDMELLAAAEAARKEAIEVDSFTLAELRRELLRDEQEVLTSV